MKSSLVIIPTYNECENITLMLDAVLDTSTDAHILVVDDNSPDETAVLVSEYEHSKQTGRIHLLNRSKKEGLGLAYIAGFKWALDRAYKYIFQMDADFSHNPKDLPRLYAACAHDGAAMSIGSRYKSGINVVNWPLGRVILSYGASRYVRLITGMRINDPTAGFNCYKREVLEAINLDEIRFIGYAFQIEMKYKAYRKKFKITEVPIIFTDRIRGQSKLSGGIISEAVFGVIKMKLKSLFN